MGRRLSATVRRLPRQPVVRLLLLLLAIWDSLHILRLHSLQTAALGGARPAGSTPPQQQQVYIASQHWNNGRVLRERWNDALLATVQALGAANVFVAILGSASFDETTELLQGLDAQLGALGVDRHMALSNRSHGDEIARAPPGHGWITTPGGDTALRRIPFLARLRNDALAPLQDLAAAGRRFDTVLFLNDVVFTPADVVRLLDTNAGHYAAACSLDFKRPPAYYDTFALRDSHGHETVLPTWPYFRSAQSRRAAERFEPVPVSSCWNGMVAMPAAPFTAPQQPLRFRAAPDSLAASHLEGSECCLIHADNPLSPARGIFLNPNIRVAYDGTTYDAIHSPQNALSVFGVWAAVWHSRFMRWTTTPLFKEWVVHNRVRQWARKTGGREKGLFCLINEMQVLYDKGWKHV